MDEHVYLRELEAQTGGGPAGPPSSTSEVEIRRLNQALKDAQRLIRGYTEESQRHQRDHVCFPRELVPPGVGGNIQNVIQAGFGSVLRPWVMALPLREQGSLLAGIRGCDTVVNKYIQVPGDPTWYPEPHPTKIVVRMLRYAVCNPADDREVGAQQSFMADWRVERFDPRAWPVKCLDDLPTHFVAHLMHAIEIVAYRHPVDLDKQMWDRMYGRICDHLHVQPEFRGQMMSRLSEDRIARGTVTPRQEPPRQGSIGVAAAAIEAEIRQRINSAPEYP